MSVVVPSGYQCFLEGSADHILIVMQNKQLTLVRDPNDPHGMMPDVE
jgi:hypothetical protein